MKSSEIIINKYNMKVLVLIQRYLTGDVVRILQTAT